MKKLKVAITGGIGAGKSFVTDLFLKEGYFVIKADELAKELMHTDKELQNKIIKEFGKESFINGQPNTKFLGEKVFSDLENVGKINSLVHPVTMDKIEEMCEEQFKKHNIVFIETALVYEANLEDFFDVVVLVLANPQNRLKRAAERDKVTEDHILKRMEFQIPDEEKKSDADFVIENNSTLKELENRSKFILILLNQMLNWSCKIDVSLLILIQQKFY